MKKNLIKPALFSVAAGILIGTMTLSASAAGLLEEIDATRYAISLQDGSNPWNQISEHNDTVFDLSITSNNKELPEITILKGETLKNLDLNWLYYDNETGECLNTVNTSAFAGKICANTAAYSENIGCLNSNSLFPEIRVNDEEGIDVSSNNITGLKTGKYELTMCWQFTLPFQRRLFIRENDWNNLDYVDAMSTLIPVININNYDYYREKLLNNLENKSGINIFSVIWDGNDEVFTKILREAGTTGNKGESYEMINVNYYPEAFNCIIVAKTIKVNVIDEIDCVFTINGEDKEFDENFKLTVNEGQIVNIENFKFTDDVNKLSVSPKITVYSGDDILNSFTKKVSVTKNKPVKFEVVIGGKKKIYIIESNGEEIEEVTPHFETDSVTINLDDGKTYIEIPSIVFPDGHIGKTNDNYSVRYESLTPEIVVIDNGKLIVGEYNITDDKIKNSQLNSLERASEDSIKRNTNFDTNSAFSLNRNNYSNYIDYFFAKIKNYVNLAEIYFQELNSDKNHDSVDTGANLAIYDIIPLSDIDLPATGKIVAYITLNDGKFSNNLILQARESYEKKFGTKFNSGDLLNYNNEDASTIVVPLTVNVKGSYKVSENGARGISPTIITRKGTGKGGLLDTVPLVVMRNGEEISDYDVVIKNENGSTYAGTSVKVNNGNIEIYDKIANVKIEVRYKNSLLGTCSVKVSLNSNTENYTGGSTITDSDSKPDSDIEKPDTSQSQDNSNTNSDNKNPNNTTSGNDNNSGNKTDSKDETIIDENGTKNNTYSLVISKTAITIKNGEQASINVSKNGESSFGSTDYILWSSSDNSVVMVMKDNSNQSKATIKTYKAGKATVTATDVNGNTVSCVVTVTDDSTSAQNTTSNTTTSKTENKPDTPTDSGTSTSSDSDIFDRVDFNDLESALDEMDNFEDLFKDMDW